jgi:hypothetical protein
MRVVPCLLTALAVSLSAFGRDATAPSNPAQPASDTRQYSIKAGAGLSLKLDLKLPDISRQRYIPQAPTQASEDIVPGLNATPAEQGSDSAWPYFLLGLLILGGSAAWYLRRHRNPVPAPAPYPKSGRQAPALNPFEPDEEPQGEEPNKAESEPPGEQANGSIQLLKSHIEQSPGESPVPWLLLLDLLHRTGDAQEYEETRKRCKQYFNVDMPAFKKIKTASKRQGIESYPHIMNKLVRLWPGEEAFSYLNALLHDSRDGSRVGFDLATYHDIALLRSVLETVSVSQDT